MSLLVLTSPDCASHRPPPGHPESPARLEAALRGLNDLPGVHTEAAEEASDADILRVHHAKYWSGLQALQAQAGDGTVTLDPDTHLGAGSLRATRLAAGAATAGVTHLLEGHARRVFCAVRPPGHHAEAGRAMGFCLLNHVAIATARALADARIGRVAIADFDVHHGNGTQAIFEREPRVCFASSHQAPLYPGTGAETETGVGNVFNAELSAGAGRDEFRHAWHGRLLPAMAAFRPDLIVVSAGFDAHRDDPLAGLRLGVEDYRWIGRQLARLADAHAGGRLLAVLEGGYALGALEASVRAFADGISGRD